MKRIYTLVFLILIAFGARAQSLTGQVFELNENGDSVAVAMTALQWLHTNVGTHSASDGTFTLPRTKTDTLVVSFPTYQPDTLVIGKEQNDVVIILSNAHSLSEVSVRARNGAYISTQPILTTVISQQGLRKAACCNLAESFENTIAVDMEFADAITGARHISMLGLAGVYSQILLENVPFIRLLSQQFGLGFVPGYWMESISVSKGVASVTNGYEAITGQIDVEYKKPRTNNERVFVNLYGNSLGKGELGFNSRFKVGKKKNASTILMLFAGDQFFKIDQNKDGFLDVPLNQQINLLNRWDYSIKDKVNGRCFIDFVWDNRVGGEYDYDARRDKFSSEIYGLHIDNKKLDVVAKHGFFLKGEDESIGTILSYTIQRTEAVFGLKAYTALQNSAYANILYSNKFGAKKRHKLTAGGSFQFDGFYEDLFNDHHDGAHSKAVTNEAVPGVFAEYCYIVEPKLVLMAGMRLDYNSHYNQLFWTPRVHAKWQAAENTSLRIAAGKGYRSPHVMAENVALLTSNRTYNITEELKAEEAYNAGISIVQGFKLPGGKSTIAIDYFYTHFMNQTILDMDKDAHGIMVYNLNGATNGVGNHSRSHSAQVELTMYPFKRFEIILAYRYNDVRYMSEGLMREKVLMAPHKALVNLGYSTKYDKWKFNVTLQVNGPQRLPDMSGNAAVMTSPEYASIYAESHSKPFCMLSAQITKRFRYWEIYAGAENILNVKQPYPIIDSQNPFSENFDATVVYAPITGIMGFLGVRFNLKSNPKY